MFRQAHWPALDGLRAFAVSAVILTHTWDSTFPGGWIGVDIFFVLSGFLITRLLVAEQRELGRISIIAFYRRRAVRLLPALWVMLPAVVIGAIVLSPSLTSATLQTALFTVGYTANWAAAAHQPTGLLSHMWSLSIEEQFYLVWPVLLFAVLRLRGAPVALMLTLVCIAAVVIHRIMMAQLVDPHDPQLFYRTDTRADSLLVGCALSLMVALGWTGSQRLWRTAATVGGVYILGLLLTSYNTGAWNYTIGYTLLALASASVIGAVTVQPWERLARVLSWRPLVRLGKISYSVYLWHFPIAIVLPVGPGPLLAVLTFVLSVVVAEASWRWVERPAQRWRSSYRAPHSVAV